VGWGDAWNEVLALPAWDWLVDPMADRRIAMTSRQVDQFARALENGEPLDITGEDGLAAIEMCEAAIRSARTGTAVPIPLEREAAEEPVGVVG
jgi:predicted dehydrogenase